MARTARADDDTCYDCGRDVTGGRQVLACLWKSHADGTEHWGEVPVCPECAGRRDGSRRAWLSVLVVLVTFLTAAAAFSLLP